MVYDMINFLNIWNSWVDLNCNIIVRYIPTYILKKKNNSKLSIRKYSITLKVVWGANATISKGK